MPNATADAADHLRALARRPRFTGTPDAAAARGYCQDLLRRLGYTVIERPFDYSAAVGAYATPVVGAITLVFIVAMVALPLGRHRAVGVTILLLYLATLAGIGRWLMRDAVLTLPLDRRGGVNLEARRGTEAPAVWLVAHVDSKSQPIALAARAAGIVLLAVAWGAVFAMTVHPQLQRTPGLGWEVLIIALVGAVPVIGSFVGNRSAGAVDNASGVATVLRAAELLPSSERIGVLITDAEEMGLAGARAWVATQPPAIALNCDGIDDHGPLTLMWTRPRSPRLEQALRAAAKASGEALRAIPLVPGVLVDGLAFSDARWPAVTLSRGTLATLRRIHTGRDDLEHLHGEGVERAARVLARAATLLTEQR